MPITETAHTIRKPKPSQSTSLQTNELNSTARNVSVLGLNFLGSGLRNQRISQHWTVNVCLYLSGDPLCFLGTITMILHPKHFGKHRCRLPAVLP
jgi:hypothetical protein